MQRLCGRPGCSDAASVAYGMRAEDLVFWLDVLADDAEPTAAVLCRRHADSMVVPRGWTLDDLRDPDLHLFRPPVPAPPRPRAPRQRRDLPAGEQLRFGSDTPPRIADIGDIEHTERIAEEASPSVASSRGVDGAQPGPWTPTFDEADDLDGLLSAHSPLLARAFRTADRADG